MLNKLSWTYRDLLTESHVLDAYSQVDSLIKSIIDFGSLPLSPVLHMEEKFINDILRESLAGVCHYQAERTGTSYSIGDKTQGLCAKNLHKDFINSEINCPGDETPGAKSLFFEN